MKINKDFDKAKEEWIFKPMGDIDIHTSDDFKEIVINSFNENNKNILIDGEGLNYVDSMGLGALIYILKEIQDKGFKIYLENIKPNIRKLLNITELDKMFIIRGDSGE